MRKSLVAVLTAGLLLLGVSPVWAAGQAMAAVPARQGGVVQVVLPGTGDPPDSELSPGDLADVKGQGAQDIIGGLMLIGSAANNMRDAVRSGDAVKATWAAVEFVVGAGLTAWGVGTALLPSP